MTSTNGLRDPVYKYMVLPFSIISWILALSKKILFVYSTQEISLTIVTKHTIPLDKCSCCREPLNILIMHNPKKFMTLASYITRFLIQAISNI